MTIAIIIIGVVGIWSMLSLIGSDRDRRMGAVRARVHAESVKVDNDIPAVGAPDRG